MRVYLAGPMTGYPESNYPAFHAYAKKLRGLGLDVMSPAELNAVTESLATAMRFDLMAVCESQAIALMPGWEKSKGVAIELALAHYLKLIVFDAETLEQMGTPYPCDAFCVAEAA